MHQALPLIPFREPVDTELSNQLLTTLAVRGVANSHDWQAALGRSQPTASRLLAGLSSRLLVLVLGTRYALPQGILGLPAQQPPRGVHDAFVHGPRQHWAARPVALLFWQRCARSPALSAEFRALAADMTERLMG